MIMVPNPNPMLATASLEMVAAKDDGSPDRMRLDMKKEKFNI